MSGSVGFVVSRHCSIVGPIVGPSTFIGGQSLTTPPEKQVINQSFLKEWAWEEGLDCNRSKCSGVLTWRSCVQKANFGIVFKLPDSKLVANPVESSICTAKDRRLPNCSWYIDNEAA